MSILSRWTCPSCGCDDILELVMKCPVCQKDRSTTPPPPKRPFFVGLAGPAKVGKSTTMEHLPQHLRDRGLSLEQRSFAGPLYAIVSILTRTPVAELKRRKEVLWTAEDAPLPCLVGWCPRRLLQLIGEFMRRSVSDQVWIQHAIGPSIKDVVVFDDARHDPEFEVCDRVVELKRAGVEYACDHPSSMPPAPEKVAQQITLNGMTPNVAAFALATFIEVALAADRADAPEQEGPAG